MKPIVLAYVTGDSQVIPDPSVVTHINYAFGEVNQTFDGVIVRNTAGLKAIADLKQKSPGLAVCLSIGGWTAGGFSEMSGAENNRLRFAESCAQFCDAYNLDGIDMDWEYPTSSESGIRSAPEDKANFTRLMRNIRSALGRERLLTLASHAGAYYIDFPAIIDTLDFVNIMMYDVDRPPYFHSALYASPMTRKWTCETSVQAHLDAGIPREKLTLGVPFYGHGDSKHLPDFIDYRDLLRLEGFTRCWDPAANAPYLRNSAGAVVCVYDDPESLKAKCEFARRQGLGGLMYWEYKCDDQAGTLRNAVYTGMQGDPE
jgi:chitinase